jgi:hypothetical protein
LQIARYLSSHRQKRIRILIQIIGELDDRRL